MNGPCNWPLDYCAAPASSAWAALEDDQRAVYETAAAEYLWRWTGRALGVCTVETRPCKIQPLTAVGWHSGYGRLPWTPVLIDGQWENLTCGSCGDLCLCDSPKMLRLPGVVQEVRQVVVDGLILPPASYRLDGSVLVRQDGLAWPTTQALDLPTTEPGTWSVTYDVGQPVPVGGQIAAGVLAIELFKAACNDSTCSLPKRVQSITRQGITVAMLDSFDDVDQGHTGIWVIDSWVASMTKPRQSSKIYSPDVPRPRASRSVILP